MDVGEEVRAFVLAIPTGGVVTYGQIGHVVGSVPDRLDGSFHDWMTMCRGGGSFTLMARHRRAMAV